MVCFARCGGTFLFLRNKCGCHPFESGWKYSCDTRLFPVSTSACFWVPGSLLLQVLPFQVPAESFSQLSTHHRAGHFYHGFCSLWRNRSGTSFEMIQGNVAKRARKPSPWQLLTSSHRPLLSAQVRGFPAPFMLPPPGVPAHCCPQPPWSLEGLN